jgi:serine protease inhibitor
VRAEFKYGVNQKLSTQAIELPYTGSRLSMIVLLPDASSSLQKLEAALTVDHLLKVNDQFGMRERKRCNVWLPKFRLDENLALTEILAALGLTDMFKYGLADFSGIDGTRQLVVSEVLHQAMVDVNEERY